LKHFITIILFLGAAGYEKTAAQKQKKSQNFGSQKHSQGAHDK
jgi:hypothetical protein